jgi:exopolyphosphatase/guanosine-5'-triphosphate,3'-diphosphate pyrophosphatase
MTSAERRDLPAMPAGREDVIVAGVEILLAVMEGFGFNEVLVSEADILDGLVLTMRNEAG